MVLTGIRTLVPQSNWGAEGWILHGNQVETDLELDGF